MPQLNIKPLFKILRIILQRDLILVTHQRSLREVFKLRTVPTVLFTETLVGSQKTDVPNH